ncbi:hypothetical protein TNCV_2237571 [Trichonephila clavipes]|nr:hypothetical protein TNCV_2237571 [Trichonephila clavipes]
MSPFGILRFHNCDPRAKTIVHRCLDYPDIGNEPRNFESKSSGDSTSKMATTFQTSTPFHPDSNSLLDNAAHELVIIAIRLPWSPTSCPSDTA